MSRWRLDRLIFVSLPYDIDFCYDRSRSNLEKIAAALAPFNPRLRGFPKDLPFIWDAGTLSNASVFTLDTDIGDIDLLSEVKGIGNFSEVLAESTIFHLFGSDVYVLGVDGLIKAKTAAGREKDIAGLKHLEAIREATSENEP